MVRDWHKGRPAQPISSLSLIGCSAHFPQLPVMVGWGWEGSPCSSQKCWRVRGSMPWGAFSPPLLIWLIQGGGVKPCTLPAFKGSGSPIPASPPSQSPWGDFFPSFTDLAHLGLGKPQMPCPLPALGGRVRGVGTETPDPASPNSARTAGGCCWGAFPHTLSSSPLRGEKVEPSGPGFSPGPCNQASTLSPLAILAGSGVGWGFLLLPHP